MLSRRSIGLAVLALALALVWNRWSIPGIPGSGSDAPRICFNLDHGTQPHCFFSDNYFQARDRFRSAARDAHAELHSLPIVDGLTTDVALFRAVGTGPHAQEGSFRPHQHSLLLHLSGTHGVEGYVGSGIQLAVLRDPLIQQRIAVYQKRGVSVAVVHAVNPYGMAYWRRFNEANVDLNRNALFTEAEWKDVLERPANIAGYLDISHLLNPTGLPYPGQRLVLLARSLWQILTRGFVAVKAALVTGTYHCPSCVYYGGRELQSSHRALSGWLRRNFVEAEPAVSRLALVDVHSGLGPLGMDTLMDSQATSANLTEIFGLPGDPELELGLMPYEISGLTDGASSGAAAGYDLVVGDVSNGYPTLFGDRLSRGVVSVTQEFGTVPGIAVALACIEENQIWQLEQAGAPVNRDDAATNIKAVFYPDSQRFRESVFLRGRSVFRQALNWVAEE